MTKWLLEYLWNSMACGVLLVSGGEYLPAQERICEASASQLSNISTLAN